MKKKISLTGLFSLIAFYGIVAVSIAQSPALNDSILRQSFNLAGERLPEVQYFIMESKFVNYALDGRRIGYDICKLYLKCAPAKLADKTGDEYTCSKFTLQTGDSPAMNIPALKGWTYVFKTDSDGFDEKGQVLGIEHSKFENLVDTNGKPIPPAKSYFIYNTFIDFHSFCNVFAERTICGKGIQDLTAIGQKIVHSSAFSEPPVNLGSHIAEGSFFKNGEVTLAFKGLSLINEKSCAIVGFDSGESSFKMIMNPTPEMKINTVGSSHYKGDIYIDLETKWVQKVIMDEVVVAETILPFPPNKVNTVTERNTIIQNVNEEDFKQEEK